MIHRDFHSMWTVQEQPCIILRVKTYLASQNFLQLSEKYLATESKCDSENILRLNQKNRANQKYLVTQKISCDSKSTSRFLIKICQWPVKRNYQHYNFRPTL